MPLAYLLLCSTGKEFFAHYPFMIEKFMFYCRIKNGLYVFIFLSNFVNYIIEDIKPLDLINILETYFQKIQLIYIAYIITK